MSVVPVETLAKVDNLTEAVYRLDMHADCGEGDIVKPNGESVNWTGLDIWISVSHAIGALIGDLVKLREITKRDVSIILATYGASPFTIEMHASRIARMLRADHGMGSWGAYI